MIQYNVVSYYQSYKPNSGPTKRSSHSWELTLAFLPATPKFRKTGQEHNGKKKATGRQEFITKICRNDIASNIKRT